MLSSYYRGFQDIMLIYLGGIVPYIGWMVNVLLNAGIVVSAYSGAGSSVQDVVL
jgi:hypothetical protein